MEERRTFDLSSAALHLLAMTLMLCDHLWATVIPGNQWLTCIGRLAFPIFAFMIAEGYAHTGNLRRYVLRLLCLALLTEIPFDLMYSSSVFFPYHQNVIWTFLMGIGAMELNERARKKGKLWLRIVTAAATVLLGAVLGLVTMVDYYGAGILTVLVFYFFRRRKWWCFAGQLAALYWLNVELLGGLYFEVELFGRTVEIVQQGLALFALIPIWLYRGRQGYHEKWFRWFCYGFYPVHMLLLYLLRSL